MILFTAGFPFSGKSEFCKFLCDKLSEDQYTWINPGSWRPDNYLSLTEEERQAVSVSSWEVAIETAQQALIDKPNSHLIILDTAASRLNPMRLLFRNAKIKKHQIVYVYVSANLADRQSRTNQDLSRFEADYGKAFKESLPALRPLMDHFFVVRNGNDPERIVLRETAEEVANLVVTPTHA